MTEKEETARDRLLRVVEELSKDGPRLLKRKNADYSTEADPYRNFRMFGPLGVLVRMSDKISRLQTFLENRKLEVSEESVRDTCLDIQNYAALFYAYALEDGIIKRPEGET